MIKDNSKIVKERLVQVRIACDRMTEAVRIAEETDRRMNLIGTPPTAEQESAALVALATYLAPIQEAVTSLAEAVNATDPIE